MCSTFETYASVRVLQWPQGGLVLAMMTKSQADDPEAERTCAPSSAGTPPRCCPMFWHRRSHREIPDSSPVIPPYVSSTN